MFGCFGKRRTRRWLWNRFEQERFNRNVNYSALHIRDARSLRFEYLRGLLDVFKFRVVSEAFIKCWQHWCNKHFRTFSTIKELDPNCKLNLELFSNIKKKRQIKTEKRRRKLVQHKSVERTSSIKSIHGNEIDTILLEYSLLFLIFFVCYIPLAYIFIIFRSTQHFTFSKSKYLCPSLWTLGTVFNFI